MNSLSLKSETESKNTLISNVQDIIKCYICLGKIKNPCMCPKCQKLTCEECIEKWLIEKKNQCPHCRMTLNYNQIIHVSFMTDVANYIEKINKSKKNEEQELCSKHQIQFLYFCSECNEALCSDCYMFEDKHKKHKIKKLTDIYKDHLYLIKKEKDELDIEENSLRKSLKEINDKIIDIGNSKYKKIKDMDELFRNIRNQIQIQSQEVISNLLLNKQEIENKLKEIEENMKNFSYQLKNASKIEIINQSSNLIQTLKEIKTKINTIKNPNNYSSLNNFSLIIQNPLVPKYESGIFEVKNFLSIKTDKVMYSQEMRINGLIWKMKLYPKGNATSKGEYISIFLELQSGVNESSKYYYILEMINFKKKKNYYQEYSSNFTNGECWGYSKFYRIDKIKEDGFLNENGNLVIKVYIRPESFEQLSRDLKGYIEILENKINSSGTNDEEDFKRNTRNISLNDLPFAKDFLIDLNDDKKNNEKSLDDCGLVKNNFFNKENKKNNKEDNNKIILTTKINNNYSDYVSNTTSNNNNNLNGNNNSNNINVFNSERKEKKFEYKKNKIQTNINNINNNNIFNHINHSNSNLNNNNVILPTNNLNNMKLLNMAKIEMSLDSEEEPKKNEDPFLIPKENNSVLSDDSFGVIVDSLKFGDENKSKRKFTDDKFNELNNNINYEYNNLVKNLKKKDYDGNNNYDKKYLGYMAYLNYGNGNNGQNSINTDNNSNYGKIQNPGYDYDEFKKKYYK